MTVCGCTVVSGSDANSRMVGERPSRSAARLQLGDDLLVAVAPAQPGLEGLQRLGIDAIERANAAAGGHSK